MLPRSCYCCSLRGGALAVAIVFLSLSMVSILGILFGWGAADADRFIYIEPGLCVILGVVTIVFIMQFVFDVLLLLGIRLPPTRRSSARCYILSWLIFRTVLFGIISLGSLSLLIAAVVLRYTPGLESLSVVLGGSFVLTAVISGLFWYAWVVVAVVLLAAARRRRRRHRLQQDPDGGGVEGAAPGAGAAGGAAAAGGRFTERRSRSEVELTRSGTVCRGDHQRSAEVTGRGQQR